MYIISSCLVGVKCRYNGSCATIPKLEKLIVEGKALAVCPELLGGLPIPRNPCEIQELQGKIVVRTEKHTDHTTEFENGARKTLEICRIIGADKAILKSRSPSCGYGKIYDGSFNSLMVEGNGLTAELLSKNGIEIFNEDNWNV